MKATARQERLLKHTFLDFKQTSEFLKQPLILDRAEGLYYWDVEGKRYFDAIGGIYVAVLGHRHPRVMAAMREQMERITFAPPLHGIADVALDFVEKLGSLTPGNLTYIKSFSGGSESNAAALKLARQYFMQTGQTGKYKTISVYLGYHGATWGTMAASGTGKRKTKFEPHMGGFLKVFSPIQYRDRFSSWEETCRFCARMFEDVIVNEDPATVAAVILEPICNTGGIVTPTEEYFQILRRICDEYNVLLIFDEVLTGFGRTGDLFAAQTFGVTPDIICSGKALSSGAMPIGSFMAREDIGEVFYGPPDAGLEFAHGHTFAGNPLACAVAMSVLDTLVEEELPQRARQLGQRIVQRFEGLRKYGVIREVRGKGVLIGVELVRDDETMEPFAEGNKLGDALKHTALENGLIMRINPDWFAVAPALVAGEEQIDEMCDLVEKSLADALELVS